MAKRRKILIINPFGIGDVLFTTPVIESIKQAIGDCGIGYLCNRRTEPVLRANPNIEWVFVYEKDELRELRRKSLIGYISKLACFVTDIRRKGFDTSIDLSLNREYGLICLLAGIKERIGFNYRNRGSYLTKKTDIEGYSGKHVVEYYLGLLGAAGVKPSVKNIVLYIPETDRQWAKEFLRSNGVSEGEVLVGIAPAGGASWGRDAGIKHWRSDGYAAAADRLIEEANAKVILFGSADESGICDGIKASMRNRPIEAYGRTSLLQAAALMGECKLVIANDGGPLHMAVGAGTRTVGIFGPVDENVYGQYPRDDSRHKAVKEGLSCRPCYRDFRMKDCAERACLSRIEPETVFKAAMEALQER